MKRLSLQTFTIFLSVIVFYSCGPSKKSETSEGTVSAPVKKYTLTKAPASFDYPDAGLALVSSTDNLDTGDVAFEFEVTNYELAVQTPGAETRGIANSGKGQHIHFILNNDPYSAHYESAFTKNIPEGNQCCACIPFEIISRVRKKWNGLCAQRDYRWLSRNNRRF